MRYLVHLALLLTLCSTQALANDTQLVELIVFRQSSETIPSSQVAPDSWANGATPVTSEMLRDLSDRLLALSYARMDVSPTLTDALYDLSRAGSFAAMRELVSRFPMDENERAWIIQMLRENGQTE